MLHNRYAVVSTDVPVLSQGSQRVLTGKVAPYDSVADLMSVPVGSGLFHAYLVPDFYNPPILQTKIVLAGV